MDILNSFNLKDKVTFQLYSGASAVISDSFTQCVVSSKLDYDDVRNFGFDPDSLHQLVYPTLPANVCPSDPSKYSWLIVKTLAGGRACIGEQWINPETIEVTTSSGLTIYCSASPKNAINLARQLLTQNGFKVSSITPD